MARLEEVTDSRYLQGLEEWPLKQIRARRDEVNELETSLSYLRRMVQGRLDIVIAERERRLDGDAGDVSGLVDQLPNILSEKVHAPGLGRLPSLMAPGEVDPELEARLEEILPSSGMGTLSEQSEADLDSVASSLADFNRSISHSRRAVQDVYDRLQDEIMRRYMSGEATVDQLLQ